MSDTQLTQEDCRRLLQRIKDGSATAAELDQARQFLKDNGPSSERNTIPANA